MKRRIRAGGRWLAERIAPTAMGSVADVPRLRQQTQQLRQELDRAKRRVGMLEAELQEARRLNRRVAEITDVVEEVLLPAADRDDERVRRALQRYADTL